MTEKTIQSAPGSAGQEATYEAQCHGEPDRPAGLRVCVVGASGKLGRYMVRHALDRGYEVVAVCREVSVDKLGSSRGRSRSFRGQRTTARSSSARSAGVTPSLPCWFREGSTSIHREQPRPCSTTPVPGLV